MTHHRCTGVLGAALVCALAACTSQEDEAAGVVEARETSGTTICLNADGPGGRDAYTVIQSVLGRGAYEAPDMFHAFTHIQETVDPTVGNAFVFYMHRDIDGDAASGQRVDRQRCEIKVFGNSPEILKGHNGDTFTYAWRFQLARDLPATKSFTHVFQLKGVGGNDDHPLVTITGEKRSGKNTLEIRYSTDGSSDRILATSDWDSIRGVWIQATVKAHFATQGSLKLTLQTLDGTPILNVDESNIDMIRNCDFVRPKWGIYRSIQDIADLTNAEDTVRFANFGITPGGGAPSSDCRN